MPVSVYSCSLRGLEGRLVEVEVDILPGIPAFNIVGLGDAAIQEAKERIVSAVINSRFDFPRLKKIVNLAPADLKKQGPCFDFPIAVGLLLASKQIPFYDEFRDSLFVGELALNGDLRKVNGMLLIADFAKQYGFRRIFLPHANASEASLVSDIELVPLQSLREFVLFVLGKKTILHNVVSAQNGSQHVRVPQKKPSQSELLTHSFDMAYIKGNTCAKRALEITAAGAHNILFRGPPGSGKTILARTFATILPKLNFYEAFEVTKIYSLFGKIDPHQPLIVHPPFRSVHHTASAVSIIGGGNYPHPGEMSLAHKGVLFLDEIAEFPVHTLETLRQPLEDHSITIGRASGSLTFPAHFTLVAAMNPCPCGYLHDPKRHCTCSSSTILQYQKRLSGPFLDRIDLFLDIPRADVEQISDDCKAESSSIIRARVQKARDIQTERFISIFRSVKNSALANEELSLDGDESAPPISTNSQLTLPLMRKFCQLDGPSSKLLKQAVQKFSLSNRAYFRILKVSRTIADLAGSQNILQEHVAEALQYRHKHNL